MDVWVCRQTSFKFVQSTVFLWLQCSDYSLQKKSCLFVVWAQKCFCICKYFVHLCVCVVFVQFSICFPDKVSLSNLVLLSLISIARSAA